jgi:hypothetical protein
MASNYDMASNMENRSIQQALTKYNMRNNNYDEPDYFKYGRKPIVRTDRGDMAMNNRALERKIGGRMSGGAVSNILSQMDERPRFITNKDFINPQRPTPPQYILSGQRNFVPYYNMVEMAEINSRTNANNVLSGRGIDFKKYANQAKDIIGDKAKDFAVNQGKELLKKGAELMKDPEVKQIAQDALNDPEVRKAVGKILTDVKSYVKKGGSFKKGAGIWSALGKAGTTALSVGSKVGSTAIKVGSTAVNVGAKYGSQGVAIATAVAKNPVVQKIATDVAENPQVQEAVVGLIAQQVAKLAPTKTEEPAPEEETPVEGGAIRNKKAYIKRLKAQYKRGGMMSLKEKIKERFKGKKNTTQQTLSQYEDDDDFFKEDEEEEKMYKKLLKEKASATKNQTGTEMGDLSGSGAKRGKNKRALIVKKVMKEQGLGLIQASKYVKQHNLY